MTFSALSLIFASFNPQTFEEFTRAQMPQHCAKVCASRLFRHRHGFKAGVGEMEGRGDPHFCAPKRRKIFLNPPTPNFNPPTPKIYVSATPKK